MIKPQKIWFKLNIITCEMKEKHNKDRELCSKRTAPGISSRRKN